jgi:hypothetical protein
MTLTPTERALLRKLGSMGGKAASGDKKRRDPAMCRAAGIKSGQVRRAKRDAASATQEDGDGNR